MGMRVLHTGDWHLGHSLYGVDREDEHAAFLDWLLATMAGRKVDVLLVAGDVFDSSNPPATATARWYRFLAEAYRALPALEVVVVGGNHDSAARLDAPRPLLAAMGRLHVVGALPRRNDGTIDVDRVLIEVGPDGEEKALVAAVPFLRPADLLGGAPEAVVESIRRAYAEVIAVARERRRPGQPLLTTGHLYMVGGLLSELSERKLQGGNLYAVPVDVFPDDLGYVALGHLHRQQKVGGREEIRYAGSVLPLSFTERHYDHGVVLVDLEGSRARSIEVLRIDRFRELRTVGPAPLAEVVAELAALPARSSGPEWKRPLLEVHAIIEGPEPMLQQRIQNALEGKEARLVRIAPPRVARAATAGGQAVENEPSYLLDLSPDEIFRRKWAKEYGGEPPAEMVAAYHDLLQETLAGEAA